MISALLAGVVGAAPEKGVCYTVDAVNSVSDSMTFVCRVRDYAWPTQARFTVRLRDVEAAGDPNAAAAAGRFLYERLTNARQVRLHNVQDRGYFRLTANVFVDGRDVAADMVEYGLMVSPAITVQSPRPEDTAEGKVLWDFRPAVERVRRGPLAPSAVRAEAIEKRLARQADLSRIGSETTFEEAMTILAEASEPRLPLLILWNDLERHAFVERDMPIGIEGFGRMRLDKALELILRAVSPSATPLIAVDEGGVLTIATGYGVVQKPRIGVYAVADLLSASSEDRDTQHSTGGLPGR
jgi:hypothetical protein